MNMNVQPQNNYAFKARVKMKEVKELAESLSTVSTGTAAASSGIGAVSTGAMSTTLSNVAGSAANVVGTAFSAKASGINSSGIVPSVMEVVAPHVTPATVASSQAHPSFMGSLFSTIGDFFHGFGNVKNKVKDPSK